MDNPTDPPKRGRGRPKKGEVVVKPVKVPGKRGRPPVYTPEEAKERHRKANRERMASRYAEDYAKERNERLATGWVPFGTLEERLRKKMVFMDNGCWKWVGASHNLSGIDYGLIDVDGCQTHAHREFFNMFHEEKLTDDEKLWRLCDTELCVNPDHWERRQRKKSYKDKLIQLVRNVQGSED